MTPVSLRELAELVPCTLDNVRRLHELGLIADDGDGLFAPSNVHVVRLMAAFEQAGISLEDVAKGVASGSLSFPLGLFLAEPVPMSETYEELAAGLGRPPELVRRLSTELGLPPAPDGRLRAEDAEMLTLLVSRLDLATDEELSRFARLYGGSVQRLVAAGLQLFDQAVRQRVGTFELSDAAKDALVYQKAGGFTELVSRIVPWLQRRHREHAVLDYLVAVTEGFMEERGDEAAAEVAAGLAQVVQETAAQHGGRTVKWLGDGVMVHFADSGEAILGGLELVEETERTLSVPARIGINAGAVVVQEGDYFGSTVNIAARIADYARPHEVLVSEEARQCASVGGVDFELIGDVPLKGVTRSVRLHKVTRAAAG